MSRPGPLGAVLPVRLSVCPPSDRSAARCAGRPDDRAAHRRRTAGSPTVRLMDRHESRTAGRSRVLPAANRPQPVGARRRPGRRDTPTVSPAPLTTKAPGRCHDDAATAPRPRHGGPGRPGTTRADTRSGEYGTNGPAVGGSVGEYADCAAVCRGSRCPSGACPAARPGRQCLRGPGPTIGLHISSPSTQGS